MWLSNLSMESPSLSSVSWRYPAHFKAQARKNKKKSVLKKIPYISGKWNFLANIKKKSYILSNESFCYISGNRNRKKLLIFQEVTFLAQQWKKCLLWLKSVYSVNIFVLFRKWNFLGTSLKKLLIFPEGINPEKQTKNLLWRNFVSLMTFF